MDKPQLVGKLQVLMTQREALNAMWPTRSAEELVALSMSTLGPRFIQDRKEGWSFSQARAGWKSHKRVARVGAASQTVDSLVRKDRAIHIIRLDDHRRVKLLAENQPRGSEEQLLGRRSRVLLSLGTTNSEISRSDLSAGVLRTARDSDFDKMDLE